MILRTPRTLAALLLITWSAAFAAPAQACDVPVFRYALERWPSVPYEMVVLHRGPLADDERSAAGALDASPTSNLTVRLADLASRPSASLERLWEQAGRPELPCMILRYPQEVGIVRPAWWGRLTADNAKALADSPARREVARRILEGHSAVWVLLESGDAERDAAARSLLEKHLEQANQTVELPPGLADVPQGRADIFAVLSPPVQVRFSLLAVVRADPAERVFAAMLLNSEPGLTEYASQPMVFPIYGRGRSLYALVGKGITEENVLEACRFLVGACSCIAKAENPGTDLLMAVDWEAGLDGSAVNVVEPQPLVSLATLAEADVAAADTPEPAAPAPEAPAAAPEQSTATPATRADVPEPAEAAAAPSPPTLAALAGAETNDEPISPRGAGGLVRNMLIALGLIVVVAVLLVIRIARQPRRERR
jgi:hypothetical protein